MATIIVTDGEQRSALAVVRSLGAAAHRCVVVSASGRSVAGASRMVMREIRAPDPGRAPDAFAGAVRELARTECADVLLPITEPSILAVLPHRDTIPSVIPFPDLGTFQSVCNKQHVLDVAAQIGIRVPAQSVIRSQVDRVSLDIDLPVVLKPARSVHTLPDGTRKKAGVKLVRTRTEMAEALTAYPDSAYPILAQEVITGHGTGIFVLLDGENVIARFSHRRIHEKPPSGGVSVLSRSEPMDESLYARTIALLSALGWSGVAMAEYKRDAATGEPVLMEINGRFWGSLQLAIDAGVDFPRLLVDTALGRSTTPVLGYRDVATRWEWGHVDHMLARWRSHDSTFADRLRAFVEWVRAFGPGNRAEVFRMTDPRPFRRETAEWFKAISSPE